MKFSHSQKNPAGSQAIGLISSGLINPVLHICVWKLTHITIDSDVIRAPKMPTHAPKREKRRRTSGVLGTAKQKKKGGSSWCACPEPLLTHFLTLYKQAGLQVRLRAVS